MNQDTLERLLLDRAVGALPEDVHELVDVYLNEHPEHAEEAESLKLTAGKAAEALTIGTPVLPALHVHRAAGIGDSRWRLVRRVAALAACLLIGLIMGMFLNSSSESQSVVVVKSEVSDSNISLQVKRETRKQPGMWSMTRMNKQAGQTERESSFNITWDSILASRRKGDAS